MVRIMKLRRKPSSFDSYLEGKDDPKNICRTEETTGCRTIHNPSLAKGSKLPIDPRQVRFDFRAYGHEGYSDNPRWSDFAVDVEWKDVVTAILGLALAARIERDLASLRSLRPPASNEAYEKVRQPTEAELKVVAAITVLARQIGIDTTIVTN